MLLIILLNKYIYIYIFNFNQINLILSLTNNLTMKRNEYDYSSCSINETMSTISSDNSMTKDNYLEIINNLIKENCLLKKKITDYNTNSRKFICICNNY